MAKHSGQDKKDEFEISLKGKDVPALTLDNKWYHLLGKVGFEDIKDPEKRLNELLKRQGKVNTETREIKKVKRRLMDEIVSLMDEQQGGSDEATSKIEENKRLLKECNDKLDSYEEEIMDLPRMIDEVNKELLRITMEHYYDTMQENTDDIGLKTAIRIALDHAGIVEKDAVFIKEILPHHLLAGCMEG